MHDVVLTILPLLFGSFLAILAGWTRSALVYPLGVVALALSTGFCVKLLLGVLSTGTATYLLGGWSPPWGIVFVIDTFSAGMMLLISGSALLTYLAFRAEIIEGFAEKTAAFVALLLLTVAGHMGIVATGDLFNLYVLIEVAALSGYALLGYGSGRAPLASLNYLCVGSVGASLYLLGVGYLYILTGTLNMADLAQIMLAAPVTASLHGAVAVILFGLWVKMALFPFHGWLPGAYAMSSPVAAALLAPLTTKVMVYVVIRLLIGVIPGAAIPEALPDVAMLLGTAAIFAGSLMAYRQIDQRRMIAYILVAEVGYMVGGMFIGNRTAMTGAMLHIFADALMTLTLFLALGSIARQRGEMVLANMRGLFRTMPFTMAAFVLGAMSMIGVPPLFGFFSKWYLLSGALESGQYLFMVGLLVSSLVNVVLFFRIFETAFFDEPGESVRDIEHWSRVTPLAVAAVLLIVAGLSSGLIVDRLIAGIIPASLI
ncbi:complex I subunit 5 family protein [Pseudodesulfovibrio pelocollis]|uniref:complex I subunit 5 family protein n=1 Tax=Pseudodesulfovibrio pelocollis TaxID=3051432 RepID=UPI00255AFA71|nr:proton-conducting transporter membrane subunit [Pseudodesulfovibrio sp. SB368]